MAKTYEIQDTLVSNSGVAKGMPGNAQALPDTYCALPPTVPPISKFTLACEGSATLDFRRRDSESFRILA